MKTHTSTLALLAIALLAIAVGCAAPAGACVCPCGNWKAPQFGWCKPLDDCCRQVGLFFHQHGTRICPPEPEPAPVEQSTGFYAFTAGPCSAPTQVVNLSEKDGRTYMVRAAYMGFIDNLTVSTYYEAGDSDIPYYQLNPFVTSTSGVGIVSLSSGGAVAKSFEYAAIKDETSTPDGWQIRGDLVEMSTGAVVDTQSTEGSDTCLHVLYNLAPSH